MRTQFVDLRSARQIALSPYVFNFLSLFRAIWYSSDFSNHSDNTIIRPLIP
jgi:hypothetical protein